MAKQEKHQQRLLKLEALDDIHLEAQQSIELYQVQIFKVLNKKLKQRTFKKGDFVLSIKRPIITTQKVKGKFHPKWKGPFVIIMIYSNSAYRFVKPNNNKIIMPINENS